MNEQETKVLISSLIEELNALKEACESLDRTIDKVTETQSLETAEESGGGSSDVVINTQKLINEISVLLKERDAVLVDGFKASLKGFLSQLLYLCRDADSEEVQKFILILADIRDRLKD
jgi:hypothetical protein